MHMTMAAAQAQGCGSAAVSDPEPTTVTPRACAVYAVPTKTCAGTRVNTRGPMAIAAPLVPPLRARVVVVVHGGGGDRCAPRLRWRWSRCCCASKPGQLAWGSPQVGQPAGPASTSPPSSSGATSSGCATSPSQSPPHYPPHDLLL